MERLAGEEVKKVTKRKSSKEIRVSSSGRNITTPKHLQTTSSDDQPPKKKSGCSKNLRAEIERLKNYAALIKTKKPQQREKKYINTENNKNRTEQPAEKSKYTSYVRPLDMSSDFVELSSLGTCHSVEVGTQTRSKLVTNNNGMTAMQPLPKAPAVLDNVFPNTPVAEVRIPNPKDVSNRNLLDEFSNEDILLNSQQRVDSKLEKLEEMYNTLINQNKKILKILNNQLNIRGEELSQALYEPVKGFPMATVAQFKELESAENKDKRRELYNHLLHLGGSTLRGFLHCCLGVIMTDALVCFFTWNGDSHTEMFGNTKVSNVLYQAARHCPLVRSPENKEVYKTEMLQVFKTTKQRFRNAHKTLSTRNKKGETEESIRDQITELQRMLPGDSDADDEEYESNNIDDDEHFD